MRILKQSNGVTFKMLDSTTFIVIKGRKSVTSLSAVVGLYFFNIFVNA